jgi:cytosine/adenosine deaminase-related metal-dependent hydrolase
VLDLVEVFRAVSGTHRTQWSNTLAGGTGPPSAPLGSRPTRLGSIDPGKIADLIVADGDPLEIETKIEQVYIAGKLMSMETRHTRLFAKYDGTPRGKNARKK